jgi:hypothetical protein
MLKFHGQLNAQEAQAVARALLRRQKGARLSTILLTAGAICLALGVFQLTQSNPDGAKQWIVLGVVLAIAGISMRLSERRNVVRALIAQEIGGNVEAEGIRLVSAQAETLYRWTSFERFEEHGAMVILLLVEAQALPLTASMFATPGQFQAAVAMIRANVVIR